MWRASGGGSSAADLRSALAGGWPVSRWDTPSPDTLATSRRDLFAALRSELPPALADWEGAQHLTRSLTAERGGGVAEATRLVLGMGTEQAEKVRALAYRLYSRSSANWWTDKAHAYNILVTPWPQS